MVVLSGQLSNLSGPLLRILQGAKAQVTIHPISTVARKPRQVQVHLSDETQLELVARFQQGASQKEISKAYGVHRTTVAKILARHGVTRIRGLTADQIDDAVRGYEDGKSLAKIATVLSVDPGTVRARLLERGVTMRTTRGSTS